MAAFVASPTSVRAETRRLAVLDFVNSSKDPATEWLGPAVASTLTTKLHALRSLQLLERSQLYQLLQEQKLNLTDLVDPSRAVAVGKLVGAEQAVLGEYTVFGGTVRFTARFVDVETGRIVAASQINGIIDPKNPGALWKALDHLAEATIDSLNTRVAIVKPHIEPTQEERSRLTRPPTTSLLAHEALGRGSVAFKREDFRTAATEFDRATRLDPGYMDAWLSLGEALLRSGRYRDAVPAFRRALEAIDVSIIASAAHGLGQVQQEHLAAAEYFLMAYYVAPESFTGRQALLKVAERYTALDLVTDARTAYHKLLAQPDLPAPLATSARQGLQRLKR